MEKKLTTCVRVGTEPFGGLTEDGSRFGSAPRRYRHDMERALPMAVNYIVHVVLSSDIQIFRHVILHSCSFRYSKSYSKHVTSANREVCIIANVHMQYHATTISGVQNDATTRYISIGVCNRNIVLENQLLIRRRCLFCRVSEKRLRVPIFEAIKK